jgi:cyclic pyranopterin phosphate synthase
MVRARFKARARGESGGMVDISAKPSIPREAVAEGFIRLKKETIELIRRGKIVKGDPLSMAKISGVMAAKQTSSLIPLTHPIPITKVDVKSEIMDDGVKVKTTVKTTYRTGCEVDALMATSVALLTIFDVCKQYEKDKEGQYPSTVIEGLRVTRKEKRL